MSIISDRDKEAIKKQLGDLTGQVKLVNFTQELECDYCRETSGLVKEVAELSDKINSEVHNFITDKEATEKFKVEYIPVTIFMDSKDYGIKFYGIPSGYEFATVLETIKMLSTGNSGLSQQTRDAIKKLSKPVHLQVFVTPT